MPACRSPYEEGELPGKSPDPSALAESLDWHDGAMAVFTKVREFLGLDAVRVLSGYQLNSRGPRLPVCETCGAVVAFEGQRPHTDWHRDKRH